MSRPTGPRNRLALALLVVFGIGLSTTHLLLSYNLRKATEQRTAVEVGSLVVERIQRDLIVSLSATYPLASAVRGFGSIPDFPALARELLLQYPGLMNLQLAEQGIVSHVYPLAGNERAIGHDLFADPKRNRDALRAVDRRELTLSGPVDLIQGGRAVIGRLPIFTPRENGTSRFWGFSVALIDVGTLIERSGLEGLRSVSGYDYELTVIGEERGVRRTVSRSTDEPLEDPARIEVRVPGSHWELALRPAAGWTAAELPPSVTIPPLLAMLFSLLFAANQFSQPARLARRIRRKTEELTAANARLREEAELHQRAVEALRASENRWRLLVTYAGDGLLLHDGGLQIREVNQQAAQMIGIGRMELISETGSGAARAALASLLKGSLENEGWEVHGVLRRPDGSELPVEVATLPIDHQGETRLYLTSIRDIRKRIAVERELNAVHERLEQRVAERSEELDRSNSLLRDEIMARRETERSLRRSKRDADASLEAKNRFLANVSHEIRTPINGLLGMLSLLEEETLDPRARELTQTAHEAGKRLLSLLDDLLHLARFEAREAHVEIETVELDEFAEGVAERARQRFVHLKVELLQDKEGSGAARLDRELAAQVVDQVLDWVATHATRRRITLRVTQGRCICMPHVGLEIQGDSRPAETTEEQRPALDAATLQLEVSRELIHLLDGEIEWDLDEAAHFRCNLSLPRDAATGAHGEGVPGSHARLAGLPVTVLAPCQDCGAGWHSFKHAGALVELRHRPPDIEQWLQQAEPEPGTVEVVCAALAPPMLARVHAALAARPGRSAMPVVLGGDVRDGAIPIPRPVTFAALAAALQQVASQQAEQAAEAATGQPSRHVLVVDDDPVNRMVVCSLLTNLGHRNVAVGDGPSALESIRQTPFDVVLLDIRMPGMDGPSTARRIRQITDSTTPPLLLGMTALDAGSQLAEAIDAGMNGVLEKPLSERRLREALAQFQS